MKCKRCGSRAKSNGSRYELYVRRKRYKCGCGHSFGSWEYQDDDLEELVKGSGFKTIDAWAKWITSGYKALKEGKDLSRKRGL